MFDHQGTDAIAFCCAQSGINTGIFLRGHTESTVGFRCAVSCAGPDVDISVWGHGDTRVVFRDVLELTRILHYQDLLSCTGTDADIALPRLAV
eukprot:44036-Rhodomonas_salina.1